MKENRITLSRTDYDRFKSIEEKYNLMVANKPYIILKNEYFGGTYSGHYENYVKIVDNEDEVTKLLKETIGEIKPSFEKIEKENRELKKSKINLLNNISKLETEVENLKNKNKKKGWFN